MDMRQLRERAGLRTVDVAFHLGVAESSVRNWERGRTTPRLRLDQFDDLLRLLGCTFDELVESMKESMKQRKEQVGDVPSEEEADNDEPTDQDGIT